MTGVKATQYDGTPVTAHATKGVVIATGGYAANLQMVVDTNAYWSSDYLSTSTKTTNRSSLGRRHHHGGRPWGADVTGMGLPDDADQLDRTATLPSAAATTRSTSTRPPASFRGRDLRARRVSSGGVPQRH